MQHVSVCQTNVTLHSGPLTRENVGGQKHHIEEKRVMHLLLLGRFLSGWLYLSSHQPTSYFHTDWGRPLTKRCHVGVDFISVCLNLINFLFHSRRATDATHRVWEFARRNGNNPVEGFWNIAFGFQPINAGLGGWSARLRAGRRS